MNPLYNMKFTELVNLLKDMLDIISEQVQVILSSTIKNWKLQKSTSNFSHHLTRMNHQYLVKASDIKILWNSQRMTCILCYI